MTDPDAQWISDSRKRWAVVLVAVVVVLAVAAVVVALTFDRRPRAAVRSPVPPGAHRPSPATTTPEEITSPIRSPTPTPVPATSAQEAAERLYRARRGNDRDAARVVASEAAIGTLWSAPSGNFEFQGCERSGSVTLCSFYEEGSVLVMRVDGRADVGFRVASAEFRPD